MKFVVIGCLCAGALAAVGCADGRGVPTSPSASAAVSGLAATAPGIEGTVRPAVAPSLSASPRSGDSPCDEGVLGIQRHGWDVLHDHVLERRGNRGRLEGHLCHRERFWRIWTVTWSSTCRGPATTPRSATAHSSPLSAVARSRAGPGSSRTSMRQWPSRTWAGPIMAGTGVQLQSARLSRELFLPPCALHRRTDRKNPFRATRSRTARRAVDRRWAIAIDEKLIAPTTTRLIGHHSSSGLR